MVASEITPPQNESKVPSKLSSIAHYNKFRRKPDYNFKSVISGVFKDVFSDVSNKYTSPEIRRMKLKVVGIFACLGVLGGHTYSVYRGFTRLQLYSRHLLVGMGMGVCCAFPVVSLYNLKYKQYPDIYMILRTGWISSIFGLAARGSYRFMIPYGVAGMILQAFMLGVWYQLIKPLYYYHILSWPDYVPPKWWPVQPGTGMEVYLDAVQQERLNVTYPEDLQYFSQLDHEKEEKLQKLKAMEFEQDFVYHSEIQEKQQLDPDDKLVKPKNMFGI
eukprot:119060_1